MSQTKTPAGRCRTGKVLLVNYAGFFLSANTFVPDNSLATLAATLTARGVEVEVVDLQSPSEVGRVMDLTDRGSADRVVSTMRSGDAPTAELVQRYREDRAVGEHALVELWARRLLEKIATERVSVIGFKLWAGGGLAHALELARRVREGAPDVLLVAGGPAVTYASGTLRRVSPWFDQWVAGDGEAALLTAVLGDAAPEPGVLASLDEVPFPLYSRAVYPSVDEFFRLRLIDESRGCFNRCSFCAHPHLTASASGARQRVRSAARIVDQLEYENRESGVRFFRFSGSNPPWRLVRQIGEEILRRGLDLRFAVFSSFNNCRPEDFPRLHEAGLRSIFFGVETADPELLRRAHGKDNRGTDRVIAVARAAMRAGIYTCLSFIVPSPFETAAHRRSSLDLVSRIFEQQRHGSVLALPPILTPGTRWWAAPREYGFEFAPGFDPETYLERTLKLDVGLCFPRQTWPEYGYRLGGRGFSELLVECESFLLELRGRGVVTDLDDSAYLLSLLAGEDPAHFQREVVEALLLGGSDRASALVARANERAGRPLAPHPPPGLRAA